MGERLTKEREAEIRRDVEAAVQRERGVPQAVEMAVLCGYFEALLAEIDALRAAPPTTYLHADGTEEPIGELVARLTRERDEALARVRELEAERDAWASSAGRWAGEATAQEDARHVAEAGLSVSETVRRHDEATLAETRAQLATLREAAQEHIRAVDARAGDDWWRAADRSVRMRLLAALSIPGPTLAEIRRAAQVEVLRDAVDTACDAVLAAVPCCNGTAAVHAVRRSLEKRADDLEAGR